MDAAIGATDDERRLGPCLRAHRFGEVSSVHHAEQADQLAFAFAKDDGPMADNAEAGLLGGITHARFLFRRRHRKHAREKAASFEVFGSHRAVIGDVAAHFKAAGDFLRMIAFNAAARRKVGRTGQNEIEPIFLAQDAGLAEIALADFVAIFQAVPAGRLSRQRDTFFLGFDRKEPRARKTPCRNHSYGPDPASEIEHGAGTWTPCRSVPCGQNVVGGKPMSLPELKDSEVTADGVQSFPSLDFRSLTERAGRDGARFGPTFEIMFNAAHNEKLRRQPGWAEKKMEIWHGIG